jgi:nucleoside phosphorylase
MYGDHIVILDDAWDACEQSRNFKFGEQLFPLLVKFASEYWDALAQGGKGDSEARKILGSHYAAQESEKVKNNPELCRFRTFQYKGSDVLMLSHLRIGTKDSVEDTIRVHFHWDSTDKVLVIGYCGPHRPLNV